MSNYQSLLTDEQWERLVAWRRLISPPEVVAGLIAAREFEASMERLQAMAGESSAQLADMQQGLLALAEGEQEV